MEYAVADDQAKFVDPWPKAVRVSEHVRGERAVECSERGTFGHGVRVTISGKLDQTSGALQINKLTVGAAQALTARA